MRLVIQRVKHAHVDVDGKTIGKIGLGMLVPLGVAKEDTKENAAALVNKLSELRIFEDAQGKMNLSAVDVKGEFLVVCQFTLYGDCAQGRRPSFDQAAPPLLAEEPERHGNFAGDLVRRDVRRELFRPRAELQFLWLAF